MLLGLHFLATHRVAVLKTWFISTTTSLFLCLSYNYMEEDHGILKIFQDWHSLSQYLKDTATVTQ